MYPEKFNNKTNGITQRRWLLHANPKLAKLITEKIGDGWITDLNQMKGLLSYVDDPGFQEAFYQVKQQKKDALAAYIKQELGIEVDPHSIFDIQVKRLHEYKRQLLNVLHIIYLYYNLRVNPGLDMVPRTFIFGAKAAASYRRAKLIIKLINAVADLVNHDPNIGGKLKVVFLPNYRVSLAEKLIPAADISEQISTAGKEASGTGNMKFMLNGAVTIGTMDGANVEIREEVGPDNIFIFGLRAQEVEERVRTNSYDPWMLYNMDQNIRIAVMELINGTFCKDTEVFREVYDSLLNGVDGGRPDSYFVLADFESYAQTQMEVDRVYRDRARWAKMAITNIACSGKFSSDRTIREYADEIWHITPMTVED